MDRDRVSNPARTSMVSVRLARSEDASALSSLIAEMGYEADPTEISSRLRRLPDDHAVFAAVEDSQMVGFVHVYVDHSLIVPRRAQLGGIAVNETRQGRGVGSVLMDAAEGWARDAGCEALWIRSGADRVRAHDFYRRRGFSEVKRQSVLVKSLAPL